MATTTETRGTLATYTIRQWVGGFLLARKVEGRAATTLAFYKEKLESFLSFAERQHVTAIESIDANLIREFILELESSGHNPGGVHGYYRSLKAFLRWYENEDAPEGWRNPIRKVKAPKVPEQILEPANLSDISAMLDTCDSSKRGLRDKALLLTLLDTGSRASELMGFDLADLEPVTGTLTIRKGKGGKSRVVFLGQKARRAVRLYLKARGASPGALFQSRYGGQFTYDGLRNVVKRRAEAAGVRVPSLHSFRRAFALEMLRAGTNLLTLQRLLGHADLSVLKLYVKQNADDLRTAHAAASPVDRQF
jgi:site-specific recombinase XerD